MPSLLKVGTGLEAACLDEGGEEGWQCAVCHVPEREAAGGSVLLRRLRHLRHLKVGTFSSTQKYKQITRKYSEADAAEVSPQSKGGRRC